MITETFQAGKKIGVTVLVFELSAPESEFSTYLRSFKGQITFTYIIKILVFTSG
jgi:hypothetical protein